MNFAGSLAKVGKLWNSKLHPATFVLQKFVDYVEDETLQRAMVKHLSEKGNLTTLNLIHEARAFHVIHTKDKGTR